MRSRSVCLRVRCDAAPQEGRRCGRVAPERRSEIESCHKKAPRCAAGLSMWRQRVVVMTPRGLWAPW